MYHGFTVRITDATLRALDLIREIGEYQIRNMPPTTEVLRGVFMVPESRIHQDAETARTLGADLINVVENGRCVWHCTNYDQIRDGVQEQRKAACERRRLSAS